MNKMKFKEFIKPTIGNEILTVVLLLIPFMNNTICSLTVNGDDCHTKYLSVFTLGLSGLTNSGYIWTSILILVASIIVFYLISCLIIYIYKKIRNKK